jgi:DNA-binding beta-propeller fold protein YncE
LWEYKDESVLNYPFGVTVDNDANVYVTSYTSNNVVVIEPDGRQGRQIVSSDDGFLSHPYISMQEQFSRTSFTFED